MKVPNTSKDAAYAASIREGATEEDIKKYLATLPREAIIDMIEKLQKEVAKMMA